MAEYVYCDHCDYREPIEFADIPKLHGTMCPKCGKGPIVGDEDLRIWKVTDGAIKAGILILVDEDTLFNDEEHCFVVDTGKLKRTGK